MWILETLHLYSPFDIVVTYRRNHSLKQQHIPSMSYMCIRLVAQLRRHSSDLYVHTHSNTDDLACVKYS